jgi:hypothetical protein
VTGGAGEAGFNRALRNGQKLLVNNKIMTLIVGCVSTLSNYYNQQVDNLVKKIGCKLRYSTKIEHFN